jgi:small-conductance mechanosensitive channel
VEPSVVGSARSKTSKPVDLDEAVFGDDDSDASVGEATVTSVSELPNKSQRLSALTHTMAEKQEGISMSFQHMISKLAKMVDPKDKKRSKKAAEYKQLAASAAKKQVRIAHQFESLVARLEQEAIDKEREMAELMRQLAALKAKIKGGHEVTTAETEDLTMDYSTPKRKNSDRSRNLPPRTRHGRSSNSVKSNATSEMFPIKEISFSNTVVDVADHLDEVANHLDELESKESGHTGDLVRMLM